MRHSLTNLLLAMCVLLGMASCKIIKNPDPNSAEEVESQQTDEARMAKYAREIWDTKVLPAVAEKLVNITELRTLLKQDVDAAGKAHGLRPEGEANPWNFAVSGTGKIIEAKTKSRAAKLQVDTDADGVADVTVQLGPVVRGTAIRDAMPFLIFTDFRDQIEFAKLAGGLNAMAHERLTFPKGDAVGLTVSFEGIFTFKNLNSKPEVVPTSLSFGSR